MTRCPEAEEIRHHLVILSSCHPVTRHPVEEILLAGRLGHGNELSGGRTGAAAQLASRLARFTRHLALGITFFTNAGLIEALAAQADLAIGWIDPQHLDLDLVADLDHFLRAFDLR